jgi:hypothetical protein
VTLRGNDDLAPIAAFEPAADDLLGHAEEFGARRHGIHLRGVKEVDPGVDGAVHDGKGRLFIGLEAEGHGSHADVRDDDAGAAEAVAFHKSSMLERVTASWQMRMRSPHIHGLPSATASASSPLSPRSNHEKSLFHHFVFLFFLPGLSDLVSRVKGGSSKRHRILRSHADRRRL